MAIICKPAHITNEQKIEDNYMENKHVILCRILCVNQKEKKYIYIKIKKTSNPG